VNIEIVHEARLAQSLKGDEPFRPAPGGVITRTRGPNVVNRRCTLGFNAYRAVNAQPVFVTNSHCTDTQGLELSSRFGQPFDSAPFFIGTELRDPPFPRWSDAALVAYDTAAIMQHGAIARTTYGGQALGSLDVDPNNPRFWIRSEYGHPTGGEFLNKMGAETGWTQGFVDRTCVDRTVRGNTVWCSSRVQAWAWEGDSGSPVFAISSGNNVVLYGILWGVDDSNGTTFLFSSMNNLEYDLGDLVTNQ
jgi:hypothetical protein